MSLQIKNLTLWQNQQTLFNNINLSVSQGEIVCLYGPSGCGKTTLLNAIAGFHDECSGQILLNGNSLMRYRPARTFKIGYVFQDIALFPHMSIFDNIAYAFNVKHAKDERIEKVETLLNMVDLPNISHKYPHQLSGGQKQRIAIARALASNPDVLLMDEPFSSVDVDCTTCITRDMRELILAQKIPTLLVSHNLNEAENFADAIYGISEQNFYPFEMPIPLYNPAA